MATTTTINLAWTTIGKMTATCEMALMVNYSNSRKIHSIFLISPTTTIPIGVTSRTTTQAPLATNQGWSTSTRPFIQAMDCPRLAYIPSSCPVSRTVPQCTNHRGQHLKNISSRCDSNMISSISVVGVCLGSSISSANSFHTSYG